LWVSASAGIVPLTPTPCQATVATTRRRAMQPHWHEYNPWADRVVYVPIEELADALAGGDIRNVDGDVVPMDAEYLLEHWNSLGDHLDAYILPNGQLGHSVGIRYGAEGREYGSSHNRNPDLVDELLEKYRDQPHYTPGR
jgi:hypothetical protein